MHLARTNFQQISNFHKLTGLPKQRKRISKIIASVCIIFIPVILATYRGSHYQCQVAIKYSPLALFWLTQPGKLPVPLPQNGRVGFAKSCSYLIGQPFYKARCILGRVASVAGARPQQQWPSMGGVPSLGQPRPGNPVEGNGRHTRVKAPSHRVAGGG